MSLTTFYDPNHAPDPKEWLALDEHERARLARRFHETARIRLPDAKAQAFCHAIVENQIAEEFGPSCRAVDRLMKEGLARHDANHAIASKVAKFTFEMVRGENKPSAPELQRQLNAEIESLSAASWKAEK